MTRAAMRNAHLILEETEEAALVPLPATPQRGDRAPLGEIVLNDQDPPKIQLEVDLGKPVKQPSSNKGKSGACKKSSNKENKVPDIAPEVLEDDCESSASSAVEEACEELRGAHDSG